MSFASVSLIVTSAIVPGQETESHYKHNFYSLNISECSIH